MTLSDAAEGIIATIRSYEETRKREAQRARRLVIARARLRMDLYAAGVLRMAVDQPRNPHTGEWVDMPGSLSGVTTPKVDERWLHLSSHERDLRVSADDLIANGGTAWHLAPPSYEPGADLVARDLQSDHGIVSDWKWDEAPEGFDGDAVALFPDSAVGREEADWFWSDHEDFVLLRVKVPPKDHRDRDMRMLEEGYPAVIDTIPAGWLEEVRRGYDDGPLAS